MKLLAAFAIGIPMGDFFCFVFCIKTKNEVGFPEGVPLGKRAKPFSLTPRLEGMRII